MQVKINAQQIKSLHEQGLSRKAIAKETGYPLKAVNAVYEALGIKREKTVYVIELDGEVETPNTIINETPEIVNEFKPVEIYTKDELDNSDMLIIQNNSDIEL